MMSQRQIGKRPATHQQHQRQRACHDRAELASGVEHHPSTQTLEPVGGSLVLDLAETDGELLDEVRRRLWGLPCVEQVKGRLKLLNLLAAARARLYVDARPLICGRGRVQQKI